ncbi:HEAT repeat domain-containing protein [Streptomyces sp. NBC_01343]|uniref:HEAT repeat domain-containing protein n=1 Tax=Streptomyces sp. NBC_01343 TaxID=2903832 RepID=UPI002E0E92B5|nr:HEAT repeat domain-containing protein [Streptomyces sp. NBC_01343]
MGVDAQRRAEEGRAAAAELLRGGRLGIGGARRPVLPVSWIAFDAEVRRGHGPRFPGPRGADRIEVRLCHPDGRIREAALRAASPPLPLVAIRCADWAPAVRERARQVLAASLAADPARTLIDLTPLVLRLAGREQGRWARELFEEALGAQDPVLSPWWRPARPAQWWRPARDARTMTGEQPDTVLGWLRRSGDLATRRFAARITLDAGLFGVRELARRAGQEQDPATARLWADAALAALAADGPDDEAIGHLLRGHVPMVRAGGVTALRRAGRCAEAADHLADRSGLVRACARWLVKQDGGDPYVLCRALVEDPSRVTAYAVAGFAECARRTDAPLLRALLDHPAGAVRAAAVAGLRTLDTTDVDLLRPLLDDPSAAVAREASVSLAGVGGRLPADWLLARIAPDRPAHTRRAAYRVLHARGGVIGLRASVELLTDADPGLRRIAAQRVQSLWSPYRPPELPRGDPEVAALLDRCTDLFSDYVMGRMRSQLGIPRGVSGRTGY